MKSSVVFLLSLTLLLLSTTAVVGSVNPSRCFKNTERLSCEDTCASGCSYVSVGRGQGYYRWCCEEEEEQDETTTMTSSSHDHKQEETTQEEQEMAAQYISKAAVLSTKAYNFVSDMVVTVSKALTVPAE